MHRAIVARTARIGIIGLGYVGLPLACLFAEKGFPTIGFDIDTPKVTALNAGRSYIKHIPGKRIAAVRKSGKFDATDDFARLKQMDAIIICVPTPLTKYREPDLQFIVKTGAGDRAATCARASWSCWNPPPIPAPRARI